MSWEADSSIITRHGRNISCAVSFKDAQQSVMIQIRTFLLLLVLTALPANVEGQVNKRMMGGSFAELRNTSVAYISFESSTGSAICTGVLVGRREVLTAAHCADQGFNYVVYIGGATYSVSQGFYHGSYVPGGEVLFNAPYDIGMLILSTDVTTANPLPILFKDKVLPGEQIGIFGFGFNETGYNGYDAGKIGSAFITSVSGGVLSSAHYTNGMSTCAGDSGGPSIQLFGSFSGVVGITSAGLNKSVGSTCYLFGDGAFFLVDLQSAASQNFLLQFSGVQYISGYRIYVANQSTYLSGQSKSLLKTKSTSLKTKLKGVIKQLNGLFRYSDGSRTTSLKAALKDLKSAQSATSLQASQALIKKAQKKIQKVASMGVY